jgi:uncharacterized membrane protein YfcA
VTTFFVLQMLALGISVGLISNALGLGGGVFMVPGFLAFVEGIDAKTAKGTSLVVIVLVAAVNTWRLNRGRENWNWRLAGIIASGSIVGSYASSWLTTRPYVSNAAVIWCFIGLLLLTGIRTFFIKEPKVTEKDLRTRGVTAIFIGLMTGLVAGATGVGGGVVLVPLALVAGIITNKRVVALSNMVMVATCTVGALTHAMAERTVDLPLTYGNVNLALVPLVFIAAQVAGPAGRWVNGHLGLRRRKVIMGVVVILIAVQLAYRAIR